MTDFELPSRLGRALRTAVPTSRHAELVLDAVLLALGDQAIRTTMNSGQWISVFRRDTSAPGLVYPRLIIQLSIGQLQGHYMDHEGVASNAPPAPKEGTKPLRRELIGGEIKFTDGNSELNILYAQGGTFAEMCSGIMSERTLALCEAIERPGQSAIEDLADFIVNSDLTQTTPARVWFPEGTAGNPLGCSHMGYSSIRKAIIQGRVPVDAQFVAVDTCTGEVVVTASTREEAVSQCRAEILVKRPKRPPPLPQDNKIQEMIDAGHQVIIGPTSDESPRSYAPEDTPIVVAELCPMPDAPPPFGEWVRLITSDFHSMAAVRRCDAHNMLMLPAQVMRKTTLAALETLLNAADEDFARKFGGITPAPWETDRPKAKYSLSKFVVNHLPQGTIEVHCQSVSTMSSYDPDSFDGGDLGSSILRVRRLPDDDL